MLDDERDSGASELARNPAFQHELPGLAAALDANAMRNYLQAALCGSALATSTIERCIVSKPVYVPGECCIVQYQLQITDHMGGPLRTPLVIGRVYPSHAACTDYIRDHLTPLAAQMHGRDEIAPFVAPVALIEPLHMAVHVFPIDGELPTLVGATDPQRMLAVFRDVLPDAQAGCVTLTACHIDVVVYRRRGRCVLRYSIEGVARGSAEPRQYVVYGKLNADSAIVPTSMIPTRQGQAAQEYNGAAWGATRSGGACSIGMIWLCEPATNGLSALTLASYRGRYTMISVRCGGGQYAAAQRCTTERMYVCESHRLFHSG